MRRKLDSTASRVGPVGAHDFGRDAFQMDAPPAVTLFSLLTIELNFGPLPSLLNLVSLVANNDARCPDVGAVVVCRGCLCAGGPRAGEGSGDKLEAAGLAPPCPFRTDRETVGG